MPRGRTARRAERQVFPGARRWRIAGRVARIPARPDTAGLMVFKLVTAGAKSWRRLHGPNQLPKVVQGVTFRNGVEVTDTPEQTGT